MVKRNETIWSQTTLLYKSKFLRGSSAEIFCGL